MNKKITTKSHTHPQIALIGRVNVGKSTLFNRLAGESKALVSDIPGTTRDTKRTIIEWQNSIIEIIDTGGYIVKDKSSKQNKQKTKTGEDIEEHTLEHTQKAIKNADLILFVVDTLSGITPTDREIAKSLHTKKNAGIHVLLVANKADSPSKRRDANIFLKLGLGDPISVSAANGSGSGDLLDIIVELIGKEKTKKTTEERETQTTICILGKPNVGKSTLMNAILGEEFAIVSPHAHTTREPNDAEIAYDGHTFTIIDTAGIRKKMLQKADPLEKGGVALSKKSLNKSNIAWLVLDATDLISVQDRKLAREITDSNKGCIIVVNKWDQVKNKSADSSKLFANTIAGHYPHLSWAPVLYISALHKKNITHILDKTIEVAKYRNSFIPDNALDRVLKKALKQKHPPLVGAKKKRPFLSNITQSKISPPTFTIASNSIYKLAPHYIKYLENQIRTKFLLVGTPIVVQIYYKKPPKKKK